MAGKSGRSINKVPKSPMKQMSLQLGKASWYSHLSCSKYFLYNFFLGSII